MISINKVVETTAALASGMPCVSEEYAVVEGEWLA
jgi:hypothetical protein